MLTILATDSLARIALQKFAMKLQLGINYRPSKFPIMNQARRNNNKLITQIKPLVTSVKRPVYKQPNSQHVSNASTVAYTCR